MQHSDRLVIHEKSYIIQRKEEQPKGGRRWTGWSLINIWEGITQSGNFGTSADHCGAVG